jgi:hypothetical protein
VVRTSEAEADQLREHWPDLFGADGKIRPQAARVQARAEVTAG